MNGDGKRLLVSIHSGTGWTDTGADLRLVKPGEWAGMPAALRVVRFASENLPADVPPLSASVLLLSPMVVAHFRPDRELAAVNLPDGSVFLAPLPDDPAAAEAARAGLADLFTERSPAPGSAPPPSAASTRAGTLPPDGTREPRPREPRKPAPKAGPKTLTAAQARRMKSVEARIGRFLSDHPDGLTEAELQTMVCRTKAFRSAMLDVHTCLKRIARRLPGDPARWVLPEGDGRREPRAMPFRKTYPKVRKPGIAGVRFHWSEESSALVRRRRDEGASMTAIAHELGQGANKNVVAGKIHRMRRCDASGLGGAQ